MVEETKYQIEAFMTGFYELIPPKAFKLLTTADFGLRLAGK